MMTINEPKKILAKFAIYLIMARSFLIIPMIGLHLICDSKAMARFFKLVWPLAMLIFILAIYSLGQLNQFPSVIGQSRDMLLTFVVFGFLSSIPHRMGGERLAFNTIRNGAVVIGFGKMAILFISAVTGMPTGTIIKAVSKVWDIQLMTLGVQDSFLTRLQIPMDSVTPFILYVLVGQILISKQRKLLNVICLVVLIISILLTFSRFFWAVSVVAIALSLIFNAKLSTKIYYTMVAFVFGWALYSFTPVGDTVSKILETRIGGSVNTSSDVVRDVQANAMSHHYLDNPIFGHGIGYFIPSLIRAPETPYLYENQTQSMLMDLGIVGASIYLLVLLMVIFGSCYDKTETRFINIMMTFAFLGLWLVGGLFNPLLFGASGGAILFFCARHHAVIDYYKAEHLPSPVSERELA
ncbi:hypothetical protein SC206_01090 [Rouxiella sp. T17]|uniref:O-antigen ligase family protein n=1 Tax=Rouxiella sp. T17 TaxID=3085684 RepID=UPI002FC87CCA